MLIILILFILFGLLIVVIAGRWKTYEKAGEPGWACLIPIYSTLILLKIARVPWWWILLIMFIPFAGIVWAIWALNRTAKGFGKDEGFTLGLIFLGFIFWPILGFGDSEYQPERLSTISS